MENIDYNKIIDDMRKDIDGKCKQIFQKYKKLGISYNYNRIVFSGKYMFVISRTVGGGMDIICFNLFFPLIPKFIVKDRERRSVSGLVREAKNYVKFLELYPLLDKKLNRKIEKRESEEKLAREYVESEINKVAKIVQDL